jgi:S1-C subfamily serine protease
MGFAGGRQLWKAWGIPRSAVGRLDDRVGLETALGRVRRAVRSGSGFVADTVGPHRYQLRSDGEPLFESGFSGSAVRASSGVVVGMLTSRDGRTQDATSSIGFLVSIEGIVEAFPQLREHVGWRFETDSRLRAAWRWEDDDLARPTLGSYFTGRDAALSELLSTAEDRL